MRSSTVWSATSAAVDPGRRTPYAPEVILRDALPTPVAPDERTGDLASAWAPALAILSLGAGFLHAAVIDGHRGHGIASQLFTAAAIFQVAWAALVLVRPTRLVVVVGALGNLAIAVGWVLSRTTGISFLSGFEDVEEVGFTDAVTTALEVALVLGAAILVVAGGRWRSPARWLRPASVGIVGVAVALVGVPAVASAGSHGGAAAGTGAAAGHHGGAPQSAAGGGGAGHHAAADPSTATPEQRAAADALLADTRAGLWQWTDDKKVYDAGFRSINDGATGYEHLVNWDWINDDAVLDPDKPESLVYRVADDGKKYLEAAMYMAPAGTPDAEVPDVGGPITQWHIHNDLCYSPVRMVDGAPQRVVVGLTSGPGQCSRGEYLSPQAPMLHVWTVERECGPFASLEGIGAGQKITEQQDPNAPTACQHSR